MIRWTSALLALLLCGLALGFWLSREPHGRGPTDAGQRGSEAAPLAPGEREPPPRAVAAEPPGAGLDALQPSREVAAQASVSGRLVLPGGEPAVGVALRLSASSDLVLAVSPPPPPGWRDVTDESGLDGGFLLPFDPPPAASFRLAAELAGHREVVWALGSVEPGEQRDLGEVTLLATGTLEVRIEEHDGRPARGPWTVVLRAPGTGPGTRAARTLQLSAEIERESGVARLDDVPVGLVEVRASSPLSGSVQGPRATVAAGELTRVTLRYGGVDLSRRVLVQAQSQPFRYVDIDDDAFVLRGHGLERRSVRDPHSFAHIFDEVEPGTYAVELDDVRYEPWRQEGVEPGQRVLADLTGSSGLLLTVLDAASGRALERYSLRVRLEESRLRPNETQILWLHQQPPERGLFSGFVAGPQTAIVEAPGHAPLELAIPDLRPRETRALVAHLLRPARIAGRVVHPGGAAEPRAVVQLIEPGFGPRLHEPGVRWIFHGPEPSRILATRADGDGRFSFDTVAAGSWTLHAYGNPWLVATLENLLVGVGEEIEDLQVELPPSAQVHGRIRLPAPSAAGQSSIAFEPLRSSLVLGSSDSLPAAAISPDGTFASGPLPPGRIRILLRPPAGEMPDGSGGTLLVIPQDSFLREIELRPGESAEIELDATASAPGHLTVRMEGADAHSGLVLVRARAQGPPPSHDAVSPVDPEGVAELGPLQPGVYRLSAIVEGSFGAYDDPTPVTIGAGERIERRLHLARAASAVVLVDAASGQPLRSVQATVSQAGQFGAGLNRVTDAEGRLWLELFPGTYAVWLARQNPDAGAQLEWTASGPAQATLVLEAGN